MTRVLSMICAFAGAAALMALSASRGKGATGPAAAESTPSLRRETRTMNLRLRAPADEIFPLFGPVREAEWAMGWAPKFASPNPPAQDPDCAVFTTQGHGGEATWVMTQFDSTSRQVNYVVVRPKVVVVEIHIAVSPAEPGRSLAAVTYRLTALSAAGNEHIREWIEQFPHMAPHWEEALTSRLATLAGEGRK